MKEVAAQDYKLQRAGLIARLLFIVLAVLCAAGLLYIAVEYDHLWTYGPFHRDIHLYAAILLFSVFTVGALLKPEYRVRMLMVVISTAFSIYLCLGVFYLIPFGNVAAEIALSKGEKYDTRSKSEFVEDSRQQGVAIDFASTPAHWLRSNGLTWNGEQLYPLAGMSRRHQVMCNESGRWIRFQTDRYGFNNPDTVWESQPHTVLIGDSYIHGVCVDDGEDVAGALRKSGWKTINLAVTGNGPLIELATLLEYARKVKPRLVLWAYYEENDLRNLKGEMSSQVLLRYLRDETFHQNLTAKRAAIDEAIGHFVSSSALKAGGTAQRMNVVLDFLKLDMVRNWLANEANPLVANRLNLARDYGAELQMLQEILSRAKRETEAWGGKIAFVYIPRWSRYAYHEEEWANLRQEVHAIAEKAGMPVFDFHKVLSAHPDPLSFFPFRINNHYSAEGNALLARELKAWVQANRLLSY
jgi:hypothetical protein